MHTMTTFSDEQRVAILNYLMDQRRAGYDLNDIIEELSNAPFPPRSPGHISLKIENLQGMSEEE